MRFKFPLQIKIILFLLFIILLVLSNQLIVPHLSVLGVIFMEGALAQVITLLALLIIAVSLPFVVKKQKYSFYSLTILLSIIVLNSFSNVMSSIFLREEVSAFITRAFGSSEYITGYLINQLLLLGLSLITLKLLFNKKKWFRNL